MKQTKFRITFKAGVQIVYAFSPLDAAIVATADMIKKGYDTTISLIEHEEKDKFIKLYSDSVILRLKLNVANI
jgi:hypothetical protein